MFIIILIFIALASLLVWYFLRHDHGRKLPVGMLWTAFGLGIGALVLASVVELMLPKDLLLYPEGYSLGMRLLVFLFVGLVEEIVKFVPLALLLYRKPYFSQHTDGVIYFAIVGLSFGLAENVLYTLSFGTGAGIFRLFATPFFHAAGTSILGYYLASFKIAPRQYRFKFILALMLIPLIHGLYDFGLASRIPVLVVFSLMLTLMLATGLFLYFAAANRLDRRRLAQVRYCTACGHPNPTTNVFCEKCGRPL